MFSSPELNPNVPAFIAKLWHLVTDPATNNLILWGPDGTSFLIRDHVQFSAKLLPMYYKHNNMASFIRQLNMYGFHKVVSVDSTSLRNDKGELEFSHSCFLRDRPALLDQIKRKMAHTKDLAGVFKGDPHILNKLLQEVQQVKSRQGMFDSKLAAMKAENDALWREHSILRQKHAQQQTIVNKLIQFLVTLVQQTRGLNLKRRVFPLMLKEGKQLATITNHAHDPSTGPIICELDPSEFYYDDITNIIDGNTLNNGSVAQDEQNNETVFNRSEPILEISVPELSPQKDSETESTQSKTLKRHSSGGGAARTTGVVKPKRRKRKFSSVLPPSETSNDGSTEINMTTNENNTSKISKNDDSLNIDYTLPIVTSPGGSSIIATSDAQLFDDLGVSFVEDVPTQQNTKLILKTEPIEQIVNSSPNSENKEESEVEKVILGNCTEEEDNADMSLVPSVVNPGTMSKEEMDNHLSMIESDLDILKDILKGDGLSLDANTLLELFSSEDPLNLNMPGADNETTNTAKDSSSGTELITYTPNLVDMVDIMKEDDAGETSGFELLDTPELNTPLSSLVGLDFPQSPATSSARRSNLP